MGMAFGEYVAVGTSLVAAVGYVPLESEIFHTKNPRVFAPGEKDEGCLLFAGTASRATGRGGFGFFITCTTGRAAGSGCVVRIFGSTEVGLCGVLESTVFEMSHWGFMVYGLWFMVYGLVGAKLGV